MKLLKISLVVLFYSVYESSGVLWNSLQVKFGVPEGYWGMPLTINEMKRNVSYYNFHLIERDRNLNVYLYSHPQDPRVILLFDSYGNIAGIRTSYIKADIERRAKQNHLPFPYDYGKISMFKEATYWGKDVWYTSVLFVNPKKLLSGGRKHTMGQVAEGLYVILDGMWVEVAKDQCEAEKQGFTKQACFVGMGLHYYYKTTPALDCREFQPFFSMYDSGQLIGFGLAPFGSFTNKDRGQQWFEDVPRKIAEIIIPTAPQCTYDWLENFGVTSLHVFLKKDARTIICPKNNALKC